MAEEVPRRMRRFHRKMERGEAVPEEALLELEEQAAELPEEKSMGETIFEQVKEKPGDEKQKTMKLALHEVKKFKETHKRLPKKEEYEQIAESIFAQLKGERGRERALQKTQRMKERLSRKTGKRVAGRAGEEKLPPLPKKKEISETLQKIKGLDIKDLFEESEQKPPAKTGEGELGELSELGLDAGEELPLKELGEEKKPEQLACPNCKAVGEETIYCPECGSAYCKKCAKKIEKMPDGRTKYYCPSCGKPVEK